jgi:hypothetical protein
MISSATNSGSDGVTLGSDVGDAGGGDGGGIGVGRGDGGDVVEVMIVAMPGKAAVVQQWQRCWWCWRWSCMVMLVMWWRWRVVAMSGKAAVLQMTLTAVCRDCCGGSDSRRWR